MIRRPRHALVAALMLIGAAALTGCGSSAATAATGTCLKPAGSPGQSQITNPSAGTDTTKTDISGIALSCYDGSGAVHLNALTMPAVVNLFAGWCEPCRQELPHVVSFAASASGRVAVVGVDTADWKTSADSVISDNHVTYPVLSDPDRKLLRATGHINLPVTLFVRPGGSVAYIYSGPPLSRADLDRLVATHLGVQVTP